MGLSVNCLKLVVWLRVIEAKWYLEDFVILHHLNHRLLLPSVVRETKLQLPVNGPGWMFDGSFCPQLISPRGFN